MSFVSLKPGESALWPAGSPQTTAKGSVDHSLRTSAADIIDCTVPFTQRMKSVTFIIVTALLCQIIYFFDRAYIYMNYNQLLSNKEASSENPLTFSWNSRIPKPNQL